MHRPSTWQIRFNFVWFVYIKDQSDIFCHILYRLCRKILTVFSHLKSGFFISSTFAHSLSMEVALNLVYPSPSAHFCRVPNALSVTMFKIVHGHVSILKVPRDFSTENYITYCKTRFVVSIVLVEGLACAMMVSRIQTCLRLKGQIIRLWSWSSSISWRCVLGG